jgi:putative flippase GtrA
MKLTTISISAKNLGRENDEKPKNLRNFREPLYYLLASGVALIIDFCTYIGLIRFAQINYLIAATAGFFGGLVVVYFLSVKFVFFARNVANKATEFTIFSLIGIAGLLLNNGILYFSVNKLLLSYEASKIVSVGIVFSFNFILRKIILFK